MHAHEQGLKRWFRVMDALEESKVKAYLGLAILAMAMVAISYCGNLPLLKNTNPPSAPSFAPSPAPSSADDYYRIVFEDRKALFRPFYYGIIAVVLCMSGVILSRWRTYIDPVPDKLIDGDEVHSARVEFADPFVQFSVLVGSFLFLLQGSGNSLLTMVSCNALQAQKDAGLDGAVWTIVVFLCSFIVPVTVVLGFALLSCHRVRRKLRANRQD
jgi:hypothetical protein